MRIMVIYNDTSGDNEGEKIAQQFEEYVSDKTEVEICISQVTNPDVDEQAVLKKAQDHGIDTLVESCHQN